ncbi:WG repeat-containing protein [Tunicatimonas pelagia]|uniref:WG repeat-containing protein n=1 Tax=Tunicatimonas pelagia TaxID=931531 RepID=UPI002665D5BD|nr:WG repeat-containing protein [Tunicatimonas pelagia]WKN41718.1 WG repeat-containing protein [Tunicatimonas pelagia]
MPRSIRGLLVLLLLLPSLVSAFNDEHFTIVEKDHKKGLFDENGKVIIPVAYEDLGWTEGLPQVYHKVIGYREAGLWGLISTKNKKLCEARYSVLIPHQDKLLIAAKATPESKGNTRYGLIDTKGETELSFRYYSLEKHQSQLIASVLRNHKPYYGLLDADGDAIVGFEYQSISVRATDRYEVMDFAGNAALFSAEGEALSAFSYDSISTFSHQLAVIYRGGKQGIIRQDGTELVSPQYYRIKIDGAQQVSVLPFNTWHVYSAENQWMRDYTFEHIQPMGTNLYQISLGKTKTFVNQEGEPIIPPHWRVEKLVGEFAVLSEDNQYGVLRSSKSSEPRHSVVLPPEFDSLLIDGRFILAARQLGEQDDNLAWSLFNNQGTSLTSFTYQAMLPQQEGLFLVKRKDHWGYIDTTGLEVIPCRYVKATSFSGGVASVDFIEGQGVIDRRGRWKIRPFSYKGARLSLERVHDDLYIFKTEARHYEPVRYGLMNSQGETLFTSFNKLINNGHSIWERDEQGKYGLVSFEGKRMMKVQYDTISPLQEEMVYVFQKEGKYGILSRDGQQLLGLDNELEELHPMSDGFLGVMIHGKYGFVDELGRLRIANRYDSITHFQNNMAAVKLLGRWGYINKSEKLIVQPHFDRASPFQGKLAVVQKDDRLGMVDRRGKEVIPVAYNRIAPAQQSRFTLEENREVRGKKMPQVGLVSANGKILIHPKYDALEDLGNGYVIIRRGKRHGLVTLNGRSTIPLKHDDLIYDSFNDVYLALEKPTWQSLDLP